MARVVDVYTPERFDNFIAKTRENGITEHGFPRLCANIGILMAHGRLLKLRPRFEEVMAICCRDIPVMPSTRSRRGNDFSIRELTACVLELEESCLYPQDTIDHWKAALRKVEPKTYYRMVAPEPPVAVDNWAAFNAASELARCAAGLADSYDYIENQIASQMFSFDENGMYRDPNDPMVYDLVTRNMLSSCLYYGYNGIHREKLEQHLRKAGKLTLLMQSVNGELPYGGRSNQFLHNEAHLAVCMEYEASAAQRNGDLEAASRFKAAAKLALDTIEHWLDTAPGQHIKNYFPNDSMVGCENYAYYDKYMVTIASFLYLAYQFCDDAIQPSQCPATDDGCYTWQSGEAFRKLFCKAGDYFVELETRSDHHYDAEGIGRIHRRGAPSAICLSVPVSQNPNYGTPEPNAMPLSLCCGKCTEEGWEYGFDADSQFTVCGHHADNEAAYATLNCQLPSGEKVSEVLCVQKDGVRIELTGSGTVGLTLPALTFDGKSTATHCLSSNTLTIYYQNWKCTYTTNGSICATALSATNRNGTYRIFCAEAETQLWVTVTILPA